MNQTVNETSLHQDWDTQALSRLVGNDPATLRRFLEMFVVRSEEQINIITDAMQTGDIQRMISTAHTLKASARSVGAERLGELCQALETAGKGNDPDTILSLIATMTQALSIARQLILHHLQQNTPKPDIE